MLKQRLHKNGSKLLVGTHISLNATESHDGQALIESVLLVGIFLFLLIGSYVAGKLILAKQTACSLERLTAFKDTYKENRIDRDEILDTENFYKNSSLNVKKESAPETSRNKFLQFFEGILNYFGATKRSQAQVRIELERKYPKLMKTIEENPGLTDSLFMDDDSFDHSSKLKWSLYAIAFGSAMLPKNTKLKSLGSEFFDKSKGAREKENFDSGD